MMFRTLAFASALLCAVAINAEARPRHQPVACVETGTVMRPTCNGNNFLAGVKSIKVTMKRRGKVSSIGLPSLDLGSIPRPIRYIAGRFVCAVNLNAALAERGIRGTGSALAHSFDHWGVRIFDPVPGAVAVTDRRGGGHVALVSRVQGSRVFVWNPSSRRRGWVEVEYTMRHARYRIAGR